MPVSPEDRRRMERQRVALQEIECDDEGTAEWREAMIRAENARRALAGQAPLEPWWAAKTEIEFYRRARALGLLARDR